MLAHRFACINITLGQHHWQWVSLHVNTLKHSQIKLWINNMVILIAGFVEVVKVVMVVE